MKKIIIYNHAAKSYFQGFVNGKPSFSWNFRRTHSYGNKEEAEAIIVAGIIPNLTQQTNQNKYWNDGFALSVLEVYV